MFSPTFSATGTSASSRMSSTDRYRGAVSVPPPRLPPRTPAADSNSHGGGNPAARGGGFAILREPAPPQGADPQLWSCFLAVDVDRSGSISIHELQTALVNGDWTPFDLDTVKLLLNLFDVNKTGEINFAEFTGLWRYIEDWRRTFQHFDKDHSGTIDGLELQSALHQFGMELSPQLLSLLMAKFGSSPSGSRVGEQTITFDRFMRACVFVKQFTDEFVNIDTDRDGWVQLTYEQILKFCLKLP